MTEPTLNVVVFFFVCAQRVLEETREHYHVIQKFVILGDLDGNPPPIPSAKRNHIPLANAPYPKMITPIPKP